MPGIVDVIRVSNLVLTWESLIFKVDGQDSSGLLSIDWEQKRERKVVWGMRRDGKPLGKGAGKYSVPSVAVKFLADSYDALTTYLTTKGLGSYGDAEFTMSLQYIEPTLIIPQTILFEGCTIDGEKNSYAEGTDELAVDVEVGCLSMTSNGKRLWSVIRSIP